MTDLLITYAKFVTASMVLYAFYRLMIASRASYFMQRAYLLSLPLVSLMMATLRFTYVPSPVVVEMERAEVSDARTAIQAADLTSPAKPVAELMEQAQQIHLHHYLLWGVVLVSASLMLLAVGNVLYIIVKTRRLSNETAKGCWKVIRSQHVHTPFSFGKSIFLPNDLTPTAEKMILRHEQAHVEHLHYVDVWLVETLTRLMWFNPVLWLSRNSLRNVHEFEADRDVVDGGVDVLAYQTLLLENIAYDSSPMANGFNHSFTRRRFAEMKRPSVAGMTSVGKTSVVAVVAVLFGLFTFTVGKGETIIRYVDGQSPEAHENIKTAEDVATEVMDTTAMLTDKDIVSTEAETIGSMPAEPLSLPTDGQETDRPTSQPVEYKATVSYQDADTVIHTKTEDKKPAVAPDGKIILKVEEIASNSNSKGKDGIILLVGDQSTMLVCQATGVDDDEYYWLAFDDNTYITDVETGDHYKARSTYPKEAWNQDFHIQGMKGKTYVMIVYFPPLPKHVKRIKISGVTKWNLRGNQIFDVADLNGKFTPARIDRW